LVTYDSSRWKRVEEDCAASYRWRLKLAHWSLRSVLGFQPTGNARVDAMANTMQDGQDAQHSDTLKVKVPEGMQVSAALGCWTGRPPFGYASVGQVDGTGKRVKRTQKLVAVKEDARTVVRIFTRFAEGATYAAIAQELQAAGVPGPFTRYANLGPRRESSGRWRSCTVRNILGNVVYTGAVVWNGKRVEGAHEAIISPKLWTTVAARLGSGRKQPKQHASNPQPYMLTGLLTCETCGGALVGGGGAHKGGSDPHKYQVYVCPASGKREVQTCDGRTLSVNQRWLEGTVCEHVGAQIAAARLTR
jgi:hypothetical protein